MTFIQYYFYFFAFPFGRFVGFGFLAAAILGAIVWSFYWKARALWSAAHRGDKLWFGVLLVVNTLGILEILYMYVFSKKKDEKQL